MADRKTAGPEPAPINIGMGAEDVELNRLRIIGKLADMADAEKMPHPDDPDRALALVGDLAIGAGADDENSTIVKRPGPVRFYVLTFHPNYGTKYGGTEGGPWEEGDPDMPSDAKRQFNYLLYVPEHDKVFPVKYTASSSAAREAKRGMNTKLVTAALGGTPMYEFAWEMTTKTNHNAAGDTWPGPVFKLVQPNPEEVAAAKQMHDSIVGDPQGELESGEPEF